MLNIVICGIASIDHNYGSQGILLPFLDMLKVDEEIHFKILLTHSMKYDSNMFNSFRYEIIKVPRVNFSSLHKLKMIKKIIQQSDIVIDLNGIEFLGDRSFLTKWKDLLTTSYYAKYSKKLNKLYLKYSKSYGPFEGIMYTKCAKKHFDNLPFLLVRGEKNRRIVEKMNLKIPVYSFPDISFALQTAEENWFNSYLGKVKKNLKPGYICYSPSVVINNLTNQNSLAGSNYVDFSIKLLEELQKTGKNILLLPHSIGDGEDLRQCDLALSKLIYNKLESNENIHLINDPKLTYSQARALIKGAQFYITGRYHSLTSALVNLVPVVPLSWHVKYSDVINMFTQNDVSIDVYKTTAEKAISEIMNRYRDRSWYNRAELEKNRKIVLAKVQESMDLINSEIIKWRADNA